MKTRYSLIFIGLLVAISAQSLEADPAPFRSISVATVELPSEPTGYTEIEVDESFLARLSPRFTLVGKAGLLRYAPENVVPRGGLGAAWDFGGGLYTDGYCVLGWASTLSLLEYEAALAFNYETDHLYSALRTLLRSRQMSFASISTLMGQWTWDSGFQAQGMFGFSWERDVGFGQSLWIEGKAPILMFLDARLGGTLSRETNGDLSASLRAGLDIQPWPDVKILYVAEPFFIDYAGVFKQTIAVDISFR